MQYLFAGKIVVDTAPTTANRRDVTARGNVLVTEASDLGLAPGIFPETVRVAARKGGFRYFTVEGVRLSGDELVSVVYMDDRGTNLRLHILND